MAGLSFNVRVDGRTHTAEVTDPQGRSRDSGGGSGAREVQVDGERFEVERAPGGALLVRRADGGHLWVTLDGQAFAAAAHIPGHSALLELETSQAAALAAALAGSNGGARAGAEIKAPMPGRVVRFLVSEGQRVAAGAAVVIVEAMKMENELHAVADGVVSRLAVAVGDTVDGGQLLCELVPDGAGGDTDADTKTATAAKTAS